MQWGKKYSKLTKLQSRNTLSQAKVRHSNFYLSKSTEVLADILKVPKVKVVTFQNNIAPR